MICIQQYACNQVTAENKEEINADPPGRAEIANPLQRAFYWVPVMEKNEENGDASKSISSATVSRSERPPEVVAFIPNYVS